MNTPRIITGLALAIICSLVLASQTSAQIKAATVDVNKLIVEYHVAKKEISALQAERDAYVKERVERQKSLKEVEDKLRAIFAKLRNKAMPKAERVNLDEQREELVSQHNALTKDLQESDRGQADQTKEKLAETSKRLLREIQQVIHQYAKDNGYQWIIDTSGTSNTQISPLVYARNAKDVTEELLAILNKDAPKPKDTPPAK